MSDAGFTWMTGCVWLIVISAYVIRVARHGRFRSDRVRFVGGGTVMVGADIMQATYWAIDPLVRFLVAVGATPNIITCAALVFGIGAGVALLFGWFGLACLLATVSTIGDILDGQVARVTRGGSPAGALLDSVVDRYTEFAFIAGFILFARESVVQVAIGLVAMLACFMISYTSAKAEALQVSPPRGLMRRHERAVYLIVGSGLTPLVGPLVAARWPTLPLTSIFVLGLAIVAIVGNIAAIRRLLYIKQMLSVPRPIALGADHSASPG